MGIETLPKFPLISLPTPIDEASRLRKTIGGPRILIKRDDLTGLAFGGNKLRKLEYLIGEALHQGADTVITSGVLQTNHGRLTAAACIKAGLDFYLIVTDDSGETIESNRILLGLMGAKLVSVGRITPRPGQTADKAKLEAGDKMIEVLVDRLKSRGKKPFVVPRGGRSLQGTAGYCAAMGEIKTQLIQKGVKVDHIVVPCATSSTLTGVLLGAKVFDLDAEVLGVALSRPADEGKQMVAEEFNKDARALGYSFAIDSRQVHIDDGYIGAGYGIPTSECYEAMELLAATEAIFLDPVYTGKAMAAYIDHVRKGSFRQDETVLFLHTGGYPLVFLHAVARHIGDVQNFETI